MKTRSRHGVVSRSCATAIRLVRAHGGDYDTERAAIRTISSRLGMSPQVRVGKLSGESRPWRHVTSAAELMSFAVTFRTPEISCRRVARSLTDPLP